MVFSRLATCTRVCLVLGLFLGCNKAPRAAEIASEVNVVGAAVAPDASERATQDNAPPQAAQDKAIDSLGAYRFPAAARLVAIGDLHGDVSATRDVLRLAGAIDESDKWVGGELIVVQTGDQLDRGDTEREILDLLQSVSEQALRAGGALHILNGNHETMNVAGDFRYVTEGGFSAFANEDSSRLPAPVLDAVGAKAKGRAAAFLPGGSYALQMAEHPLVIVVGETVFAHGGVLPEHVKYGIEKLNQEIRDWFLGKTNAGAALSGSPDAPVWTRRFSQDPVSSDACALLGETLRSLDVRRMVVGHTIQKQISAACQEQVWRIDVGMASYYGGSQVQALEIVGGQIKILSRDKSSP